MYSPQIKSTTAKIILKEGCKAINVLKWKNLCPIC